MMYNNQFVVSIRCNEKIMREHGGEVYLPFGTEYWEFKMKLHSYLSLCGATSSLMDQVRSLH
jgi:hypothetical protein